MKIKAITFSALLFSGIAANALTISTTAGQLQTDFEGNDLATTSLTVNGQIDAADFDFISNNLTKLTSLDLSGATIANYNGSHVLAGSTVYAANTLPAYALAGMKVETVVLPANLVTIEEGAFSSSSITSITIPQSVETIDNYAFANCDALTSITIPQSVVTLGEGVLMSCTELTTVTISANISELPARTFDGCSKLSSVTLPSTLTAIGASAFKGTTALETISLPETLTTVGDQAFYGSGIESISLPASVTSLGDYALAKCESLETSTFNGTPALGQGVFFDDAALANFTLPTSITVIPEFTFKGTTSIDPVQIIHDELAEVKDYALTGWTQVQTVALPSTLSYLGTGAMADWTELTEITATKLKSVPELGDDVWQNVDQPNVELKVEASVADNFKAADQWRLFNIIAEKTTGTGEQINAVASGVEYYFRGETLIIKSDSQPIIGVEIFDLDGRRRYAEQTSANAIEINTESWQRGVVVIRIFLADGTSTALKISK